MSRRVLLILLLCVVATGGRDRTRAQQSSNGDQTVTPPASSPAADQALPANSKNPQPSAATRCTLPDGTPVMLRLTQTVSSALARVNDPVKFEVAEEIRAGDVVLIFKGSQARGTVVAVKGKRTLGRSGELALRLNYVELALGQQVPLRGAKGERGTQAKGEMGAYAVASGFFFFPAAPFALLVHGHDASIPRGTTLTGYVDGSFALDHNKCRSTPGTN